MLPFFAEISIVRIVFKCLKPSLIGQYFGEYMSAVKGINKFVLNAGFVCFKMHWKKEMNLA